MIMEGDIQKPSSSIRKAQLQELIRQASKRISISSLNSSSNISQWFKRIYLDGLLVGGFVSCSRCKSIIGYESSRSSIGHLMRHLETCTEKDSSKKQTDSNSNDDSERESEDGYQVDKSKRWDRIWPAHLI